MSETSGEGRPGQQLTISGDIRPTNDGGEHKQEAAKSLPAHQDIFERLRRIPSGEDPVFWPVRVMTELEWLTDQVALPESPLAKQWAPVRESLRRIGRAYEILSYQHVKEEAWRNFIEDELETDRQLNGRDQIRLDDADTAILGKLAATAKIPFDPQKRVYAYAEVPLSPDVDPFGKRHMTTEEIRTQPNPQS